MWRHFVGKFLAVAILMGMLVLEDNNVVGETKKGLKCYACHACNDNGKNDTCEINPIDGESAVCALHQSKGKITERACGQTTPKNAKVGCFLPTSDGESTCYCITDFCNGGASGSITGTIRTPGPGSKGSTFPASKKASSIIIGVILLLTNFLLY